MSSVISIAIHGAICGPLNAPGVYTLEIVTQYSGGSKPLEEPRTIVFPGELTVPDKDRPAISPED
jgi:hypothetical protein